MAEQWDAIVIGSGIGGLATAGLLARCAGKRVLVLEKHSEPGGLTHVFRRDGATWDVGLHYVGEMEKGSMPRSLMDFLSGESLEWNRMPEDFDRFVYPGFSLAVPSNPAEYERRVIAAFPEEEKAIRRYFRDLRKTGAWNVLGFTANMTPRPVAALLGLVRRMSGKTALMTTGEYLDRHFRSGLLKALLASQWGDYGLPPSKSAFAIHAQIATHYFKGAWFPEGGSGRIARTFEKGIEAAGGSVRVCQEVRSIIVEQGKAVGVVAVDARGAEPRQVEHRAPVIVSDVGARQTFERLLPAQGKTGRKTARIRELISSLRAGGSAVNLYIRLKEPASTLGIQGENYWINSDLRHDDLAGQAKELLEGRPSHIYLSFPSAKSGETGRHTAEIIAHMDDSAFAAWKDRPHGNRGGDYSSLKDRIAAGLIDLAETALPGFRSLVDYSELSTPLSVEHFTSHEGGKFYGLPATPERYRSRLLGPVTPIAGLYLSGSDAGCLGIVGALMGGVGAAANILGSSGFPRIMASVKAFEKRASVAQATETRGGDKRRASLVSKTRLGPKVWELTWRVESSIDFAPGQYLRLRVSDWEWRDYSIASAKGQDLVLLVSTRTGGRGSAYAERIQPGEETLIEAPLGQFRLLDNERKKVFIATGTGLAPFLPMFTQLRGRREEARSELIFGCATNEENLCLRYKDLMPAATLACVSRELPARGARQGRVTGALSGRDFDPASTDFYISGSAAMVADCRSLLEAAGARHIHTEAY